MDKVVLSQFTQVLILLSRKVLPPDKSQLLISSGLLEDLLDGDLASVDRRRFRTLLNLPPLRMRLKLDYDEPILQLIQTAGFDTVEISAALTNEGDKQEGMQVVQAELIQFNDYVDTVAARKALSESTLTPADPRMLIAFGRAYPEVQRAFRIVALNDKDIMDNGYGPGVYCLSGDSLNRSLSVVSHRGQWELSTRFLASRSEGVHRQVS